MENKNFAPPKWLNDAVFYEIYPQSFYDSNGDGIGDLPGIIAKLDYIKELNVNAIWLNPCFDSPFQDAGYDVRDFYKVAPRYGTNADLQKLFDEAHKKGLKVLLDLVAGHTSIEHEWFKQSASGEKTPYDDCFIWSDGWFPNEGKYRFISGLAKRNGYYMINFFYSQPALNYGFSELDPNLIWQQPLDAPGPQKVRQELKNIMKFYLDMGCDGFRVDMAPSLIRGEEPKRSEELKKLWHEYRTWMKTNYPDAILVSEWGYPNEAVNYGFDIDFFFSWAPGKGGFRSMFRNENHFLSTTSQYQKIDIPSFLAADSSGNSREFTDEMLECLDSIKGKGYPALVTGNHDVIRFSRNRSERQIKIGYLAIFTLPGTPFLYYGDEIGMKYVENLGNIEGSYHRSGSRTPMQWTSGETAGFSTAAPDKFYAALDRDVNRPNVAKQENDPDSLLNFTRQLIKIRRANPALSTNGKFTPLISEKQDAPFVYERSSGDRRFIVALNPKKAAINFNLGLDGKIVEIINLGGCKYEIKNGTTKISMPPESAWLIELVRS